MIRDHFRSAARRHNTGGQWGRNCPARIEYGRNSGARPLDAGRCSDTLLLRPDAQSRTTRFWSLDWCVCGDLLRCRTNHQLGRFPDAPKRADYYRRVVHSHRRRNHHALAEVGCHAARKPDARFRRYWRRLPMFRPLVPGDRRVDRRPKANDHNTREHRGHSHEFQSVQSVQR
jgi:hypothetical protein